MYSVLYVDDEPDLLELAKLFLEQSPDFHVDIRTSAQEALVSPDLGSYDAIISDYQMPGMDGIAFLKLVRSTLGNVPFILFTGRGREEVVIEAINNGVDFYLQKGGDVRAQFAELSHKIRQSVARRNAERQVTESEKRLADIIDFLPDATFAIDRDGKIISWNHAIEEMTGRSAQEMLGKNDHEYALPFYGKRRPILIDLIFEPDDFISRYYSNLLREGVAITAETNLPHPKGTPITVLAKASPLYNRERQIVGAIESIRDITSRKRADDELRAAYEQITASEEELREQVEILEENEKKIRESESRLRYMIGFYEKTNAPQKELLEYAVEGAGVITGSPLGYLAFLNEDESELTMYAWSRSAMEECSLREKPIVYKTDRAGLWGEAVRQRRAVITNDYAAPNPAKKGYPKGHPEIIRHMNVPVMDDGHIVLVAGVANKPGDYIEEDVRQLSLLMQNLWLVIKRRQTKDALQESERKYRDLFENSIIGIFRTTPEGKFATINTSFARIAGYDSAAEMLAAISDIRTQLYVKNEERDQFLSALAKDGYVREFTAQFYHRDGHPVWIAINATAVRDAAGNVLYYEGTIEDITEQKRAEQALERERIFSDAVVDSVPGLLYLYDREGRLVRWNKAHETITGYSPEELGRMHLLDWYKDDDDSITAVNVGIQHTLEHGFGSAEANLQTKDGRKIPFYFTAKRLDIEGNTYFTGVGLDITERRKNQDELQAAYEQITASEEELRAQVDALTATEREAKESEEKYRTLVELSPVAVIVHRDGKIVYANPESVRLAGGASPQDVLGREIIAFIHPDYHTLAAEHFRMMKEEGKTIPLQEEVLLTLAGVPFTVEVTARPIIYRHSPSVLVVFRDITERKRIEMELRAAYEQLTASNEELRGQYEELASSEQRIRESEERYRNVVEFSPFGMHFYELLPDNTLIFTGANPAADRILGMENSSLIGKTIESAFPGLAGTEIPERYREVAARGEPWHTDQVFYELGKIQGAYAVQAFQTRPSAMVAVFFDITERKRVEEALREKTEELDRYFSTSLDLFCIADIDGNFHRLNPEWEKTLGYTLPELEGHRFLDFVHPDDLPATLAVISRLRGQEDVLNFTNRYRHKDGTYRWIEWRSRPLGDLIVAAARDITHRKEIEDTLRENEEKYRTIFENIQDVYYRENFAGNLVMASPSIVPLFGYNSLDEILGRNLAHDLWMYPEQREDFLDVIKKNGHVKNYEIIILRKDGKPLTIATSSHFIYDQDGKIVGIEGILHDITAIREADQQIQLLAGITEITPASIIVHDDQGRFLYANQRTFDLHGWPRDEFMEKNLHDLDVPVSEKLINQRIEELRRNGEASFDVEHFRKDGSRFPLHVIIKTIRWNNQDAILSVATDISDQKTSEEALRESEAKFRRIADNARDMIYRMSVPSGKYDYVSPASVAITGYTPDEFYADPGLVRSIIHPDWQDYFRNQWGALLEGKVPPTYEYQIVDRSGRTHWLNQRNVLVTDERGKPFALEGIVTDITENKLVEESLRENEARYRTIIENIQDGFIRVDPEGALVMASPSAARMFGFGSADELLGLPVQRFYYRPESRQSVLEKIRKETQISDYEIEFVRKDGSVFWGAINAHLIHDDQGKVTGTEAVIRDITDRRSMEHAIREANRKLNLLNSITRHDVANQLTALQGFVQIASMKKNDPVIADYLAKIDTVADTINRQIEFTRTYQELGVKEPAWTHVEEVIARVESRVPIRFSKTCGGVEIIADPMLERVFFNLCDNAVRHGGHVTQVTVRCEREPDGLLIIVEDDGKGIPSGEKEKIFGRGYGQNTGLGLFLAREILSITGITMKETGIPGKGARFEMLVPRGAFRQHGVKHR
jgi:PAS domain S-box-containing protein